MKRITSEQSRFYVPLDIENDKYALQKAKAFTCTPTEDGWEDVTYFGEAILDPTGSVRKPQWVYVLVNKSLPGVCKIGMTTKSVDERVREINSATGVITPWFSVYKHKCVNARSIEKTVHEKLENFGKRVNRKREGFECTTELAIATIKEVAEDYEI